MLNLPAALNELIHRLSRMPGVGPRSAERIALGLLDWNQAEIEHLSAALLDAAGRVTACPRCGALSQDNELCAICADPHREPVLCVVEGPLDAVALERGGGYSGCYHVLGGALSPMRGVLPEDLRIAELLARIRDEGITEIIVATNASPDGEATALYLKQVLEDTDVLGRSAQRGVEVDPDSPGAVGTGTAGPPLRVTRLARGLPSGAQLDYADAATLQSALHNRTEL